MSKSVTTSLSEMAASGEGSCTWNLVRWGGTIHLGAQVVFSSKHRHNETVNYAIESLRVPACKSKIAITRYR